MSDHTGIEWADATWNPVTGCNEVSPGCDHCYAKTLAERFRGTPGHYFAAGFDVVLRPQRLDQVLRWRRPRRIFVNSMSDLFHDQVPDWFIAQVFSRMALAPHHTFQLLTKRHGRMRFLLNSSDFRRFVTELTLIAANDHRLDPHAADPWPLANVWVGVSVENQRWADLRIPALLDTPAAVRFISCEPLLGPVNLEYAARVTEQPRIDWVIVGGESGAGARPMHPEWARAVRDQCAAAGVPLVFKQWGEWAPVVDAAANPSEGNGRRLKYERIFLRPDGTRAAFGDGGGPGTRMDRIGKKRAGRELDGRTWDEYPDRVEARHG